MKKIALLSTIMLQGVCVHAAPLKSQVFGYIEGYVEQVEDVPTRTGGTATSEGEVSKEASPHEFDTPNVTLMVRSSKDNKYASFLNLNASGGEVETRNAWVEMKLSNEALKFRIGKLYRPFGLYNERLDAVPTYIGIEPPELFDKDHLLLTRTTNMMLHGEKIFNSGDSLRYSLTTGNEERSGGEVPVGGDLRYTRATDDGIWTLGTSFYFSNTAKPTKGVGEGSPEGGVLPWMKQDKYNVLGLYGEMEKKAWKFQAAYYVAQHDAVRDGSALSDASVFSRDALNDEQIQRLCDGDMGTCQDSEVEYDVKTWYIRTGHSFTTKHGEITPYVQYDYYENPETVASKSNGGDAEAGIADDGKFTKQTLGVVYRPDRQLAIKLDGSNHTQEIDGETENYAEIRSSFSYIWML